MWPACSKCGMPYRLQLRFIWTHVPACLCPQPAPWNVIATDNTQQTQPK